MVVVDSDKGDGGSSPWSFRISVLFLGTAGFLLQGMFQRIHFKKHEQHVLSSGVVDSIVKDRLPVTALLWMALSVLSSFQSGWNCVFAHGIFFASFSNAIASIYLIQFEQQQQQLIWIRDPSQSRDNNHLDINDMQAPRSSQNSTILNQRFFVLLCKCLDWVVLTCWVALLVTTLSESAQSDNPIVFVSGLTFTCLVLIALFVGLARNDLNHPQQEDDSVRSAWIQRRPNFLERCCVALFPSALWFSLSPSSLNNEISASGNNLRNTMVSGDWQCRRKCADENRWYEWSVEESFQWISNQEQPGGPMAEPLSLLTEQLTCLQLVNQTTPEALRRATGISYGMALWIHQIIVQKLLQPYPLPDHIRNKMSRNWLESEHYGDSNISRERHDTQSRSLANDESISTSLDTIAYEKANQIFQDRFGSLELPQVRRPEKSNYSTPSSPLPEYEPNVPYNFPNPPTTPNLPLDVLDQMPPHIAEIARRKPELLEQILTNRKAVPIKQNTVPINATTAQGDPWKDRQKMTMQRDENNFHNNNNLMEDDLNEDDCSDGERTELLRHRRSAQGGTRDDDDYLSLSL